MQAQSPAEPPDDAAAEACQQLVSSQTSWAQRRAAVRQLGAAWAVDGGAPGVAQQVLRVGVNGLLDALLALMVSDQTADCSAEAADLLATVCCDPCCRCVGAGAAAAARRRARFRRRLQAVPKGNLGLASAVATWHAPRASLARDTLPCHAAGGAGAAVLPVGQQARTHVTPRGYHLPPPPPPPPPACMVPRLHHPPCTMPPLLQPHHLTRSRGGTADALLHPRQGGRQGGGGPRAVAAGVPQRVLPRGGPRPRAPPTPPRAAQQPAATRARRLQPRAPCLAQRL
jgi:hypothetical protein